MVQLTSKRLAAFNEYLGNQGSQYVDDPDLSPLFSLPYILTTPDMDNSPEMEALFEKEFVDGVLDDLKTLLESMSKLKSSFLYFYPSILLKKYSKISNPK